MKLAYKNYLKLLDTFTNEEKINEIKHIINKILNDKGIGGLEDNRYERLKQLKNIKNSLSL